MAKINEQIITIKLSRLARNNEEVTAILSDDELMTIIEAIQELSGSNTLIEIE